MSEFANIFRNRRNAMRSTYFLLLLSEIILTTTNSNKILKCIITYYISRRNTLQSECQWIISLNLEQYLATNLESVLSFTQETLDTASTVQRPTYLFWLIDPVWFSRQVVRIPGSWKSGYDIIPGEFINDLGLILDLLMGCSLYNSCGFPDFWH